MCVYSKLCEDGGRKMPGHCPVVTPGKSESSKLNESFCLKNLKWKEIRENT